MSLGEAVNKQRRVSINTNDVLDIQPVVYSFKGPSHSQRFGSVVTAAPPPQWLYHDHVMGVIWMIFHKEKNYVGISQLQWCLRFLLDLKNSQGEYTGDVEICIEAIQDDLIEQYAKLGPVLEKSMEENSSRKEIRRNVDAEDTQSATNEETHEEYVENKTDTDATNIDKTNEEEVQSDENETFFSAESHEIINMSTPKKKIPQASQQKNINKNKNSEEPCSSKCAAKKPKMKKENILSFTYKEMISRGPAPCTEPYFSEEIYNDQSNELSGVERDNLPDMNSSDIVTFLNSSRQQHVEMINRELDTLRVLERLLGNINSSGFPSNNAEELTRRLENFQNENVTTEHEELRNIND